MTEIKNQPYNIYDLGYSKSLTRNIPMENQEIENSFSNGIPMSMVGSLEDGKYLNDLGSAAYLDEGEITVNDVINDRIDTSQAKILADWTFGTSGAFVVGTASDGVSISPTGILAKKGGNTTFTIDSGGEATFVGTVAAGAVIAADISANNITTGTFDADLVNVTGTITGTTIQTASSGKRVRLSSIPQNQIEFLNDDALIGILEVDMIGDTGYLELLDSEGLGLKLEVGIGASVFGSSELISYGGSLYTGGTTSNGSIGMVAGDGVKYLRIIRSAGSYYMETDVELASHWDPYADDTYYLGSSSKKWAGLYTMYARSYGDVRVDEDLQVYGTIATNNLTVSNLVSFSGIPTSDPLTAGYIYRSGNDLKISTG